MAYSETRIVIGGLAHVPILIFIVNLIKANFEAKAEKPKGKKVKFKEEQEKVKNEISEKLLEIEKPAAENVNKKVKKKKKKKNKKKD